MPEKTYQIHPIGWIKRSNQDVVIEINQPYRPGLKQLEHFSHVIVLWWVDRHDNPNSRFITLTEPPYAPGKETGVFATRAEHRPNPIAITTCKLLDVDEAAGTLKVSVTDAIDGTPILDLKAYFPVCDRVKKAVIPAWLSDWPEWIPEEGLGLD